ncbi:hypothetical protein V8E54_014690 [Elaphomyces granulatus]
MVTHSYLFYLILIILTALGITHGTPINNTECPNLLETWEYSGGVSIDSDECSNRIQAWIHCGNLTVFPNGDPNNIYLHDFSKICGPGGHIYPEDDIQGRFFTWVVPLFILIGTMQFAPFGIRNAVCVVLHLLVDPFTSMWSLLSKIALNREYYRRCQSRFLRNVRDEYRQSFSIIQSICAEWEICFWIEQRSSSGSPNDPERDSVSVSLFDFLSSSDILTAEGSARLDACLRAARELSDCRTNGIWKTFLGIINYCVAVLLAFYKVQKGDVNDRTGHSIAFAILFSWLIPAVSLSSMAGGFSNKRSAWRILRRLQTEFDEIQKREMQEPGMDDKLHFEILLFDKKSSIPQSIKWCGGNYSFRPHQSYHGWEPKILYLAAIFPVLIATINAVFISYTSPTRGIGCRSLLQLFFFTCWTTSALCTHFLRRSDTGASLWRKVLFKDLAFFLLLGFLYLTAWYGLMNNPVCFSAYFSLRELAYIVLQPNDIIISLAKTIWPMLAALTLGLQLLFVGGTAIIYRRGILLFSMKDEDHEWSV